MKYELYFMGIKVAETDFLGKCFVKTFIFPNQGKNYFYHEISFDYLTSPNYKYKLGLQPSKIVKVFQYYDGIDDFGLKYKYKRYNRPMKDLFKLTKNINLWRIIK